MLPPRRRRANRGRSLLPRAADPDRGSARSVLVFVPSFVLIISSHPSWTVDVPVRFRAFPPRPRQVRRADAPHARARPRRRHGLRALPAARRRDCDRGARAPRDRGGDILARRTRGALPSSLRNDAQCQTRVRAQRRDDRTLLLTTSFTQPGNCTQNVTTSHRDLRRPSPPAGRRASALRLLRSRRMTPDHRPAPRRGPARRRRGAGAAAHLRAAAARARGLSRWRVARGSGL